MVVVGLVREILALLNGVLGNIVENNTPWTSLAPFWGTDGELNVGITDYALTPKGIMLTGAIADIMTSGAQFVDMMLQALVGGPPLAP